LESFLTLLNFELPAYKDAARYPNSETNFLCRNDHPMPSPSLVKLGSRIPENRFAEMSHP